MIRRATTLIASVMETMVELIDCDGSDGLSAVNCYYISVLLLSVQTQNRSDFAIFRDIGCVLVRALKLFRKGLGLMVW